MLSACALAIIWTNVAIAVNAPPAQTSTGIAIGRAIATVTTSPSASPLAPVVLVDLRPARLVIPRINLDATIEARGLDANRNMQTAKDFRHAAWYDLGPA